MVGREQCHSLIMMMMMMVVVVRTAFLLRKLYLTAIGQGRLVSGPFLCHHGCN